MQTTRPQAEIQQDPHGVSSPIFEGGDDFNARMIAKYEVQDPFFKALVLLCQGMSNNLSA